MVESLKELNRKCQRPHYKIMGNWMARHIVRDAALPFTWLLLHTNVSANQVTLASLAVGVLGLVAFTFPSTKAFLAGALLLQLWYYLDHVDGQIARYRNTASLSGRFFDYIVHHVIHGVFFLCLGVYAFRLTHHVFMLAVGFVGSLGVMIFNLIQDTKSKTFLERIMLLDSFYTVSGNESLKDPLAYLKKKAVNLRWQKRWFAFFHKSIEIHVLMNVITICAILEWLFFPYLVSRLSILWYGSIVSPMLAVVKITHLIWTKEIDRDFAERFSAVQ